MAATMAAAIRHAFTRSTTPKTLSSQQREELHHRNVEALHMTVVGETSEARALEAVRLSTLVECTQLKNLQRSLDERAQR